MITVKARDTFEGRQSPGHAGSYLRGFTREEGQGTEGESVLKIIQCM